jgi:beta-galactosidase
MNTKFFRESGTTLVTIFMMATVLSLAVPSLAIERQRLSMDANWRFTLDDPKDAGSQFDYPEVRDLAKTRAEAAAQEAVLTTQRSDPVALNVGSQVSYVQPDFNDSAWRQLDLPHDWVVELPFDQNGNNGHGSFKIGPDPRLGNTIGWYRRKFDLPAEDKGHVLTVEFDGVYRNCLVWINGHCLGRNVSGYTSFSFNISQFANYGGSNELVVRVDASRTEGWFYEGAGIYRHVWLVKTDPIHVARWGTFVTSQVWGQNAVVSAEAAVRNDSQSPRTIEVEETVVDDKGANVVTKNQPRILLNPGDRRIVDMNLPAIYNATLWSLEKPYLYKLVTTIRDDSGVLDTYNTTFGIRTLRFDANQGFFLNGRHVEIQGTCNHQDHAGVGTALPDAINYFRVAKLKEMGANAYRTSHNDPTPELLDACDKLGMLVMDETRQIGMTAQVTADLTHLVERDRNHPSVFIWSVGNEEPLQGSAQGAEICTYMQNIVHGLDPTRPCTQAMNNAWGSGVSTVIDIQGYNYLKQGGGGGGGRRGGTTQPATAQPSTPYPAMDRFHAAFPMKPSIGTEEASTLATRGIYENDRTHSYESAYDVNVPGWGTTAEQWWTFYLKRPYVAGAFVWTGFDYRGEPTPYRWPAVSSQFGIMDTCGFPKDDFYYYQAWWTHKPVLHILPHWNWAGKEGQPIDVRCFSNFQAVELFLNGQSLGKQTMPANSHLQWSVPYAPGTLEARGYKGDQVAMTTQIQTTGSPARVEMTPDRATINSDGRDVAVVTVAIVDAQGNTVPTASNLVKFTVSGDARIIGVGNGDPGSHEPDKAEQRSAFSGLCEVLVQSGHRGGDIQLTANSDGLLPNTLTIATQPGNPTPMVP